MNLVKNEIVYRKHEINVCKSEKEMGCNHMLRYTWLHEMPEKHTAEI